MPSLDKAQGKHVSVLLHESIDSLNLEEGDTFLDGTLGSGGHSAYVLERFGNKVHLIGLDRDPKALKRSEEKLRILSSHVRLVQESFRHLDRALALLEVKSVDAILFDLGISSDQLGDPDYGMSFQEDAPLSMSMSPDSELSAKLIVNTWDEETLELIFRGFGEEKFSRRIAREIVERRESKPFETTFDLVDAVRAATPAASHRGKLHPATRTFQALRIAVNEELTSLEDGLEKGFAALAPNGRFAVISFHSLEDRIVKQFFKQKAESNEAHLITKRPIVPTDAEVVSNPRSRSAKLRVLEKNQ